MNIGILTFHWGTNYGAVLQAWCLQTYLIELGYNVEIINYKPKQFDYSWIKVIKHPSLLRNLLIYLNGWRKEVLLGQFREMHLHMTKRYYSVDDFKGDLNKYDVLISGSDQVLNPDFTCHGESGQSSPVYWLGIGPQKAKRIGYAVSFGCERYPDKALSIATQLVNGFDAIGIRELTGKSILAQIGYHRNIEEVPDPTLLYGANLYERLGIVIPVNRASYTCVYMLRHEIHIDGDTLYLDEKHHPLTMEQWLRTIANAGRVITNSYHGSLMAIFAHVPFVVLLESLKSNSMNDRFYTLFNRLGCSNRIATTISEALDILQIPIDFPSIDNEITKYKQVGELFISRNISN